MNTPSEKKTWSLPRPIRHKFFKNVDKTSSPDGCWLWIAALRKGYGVIGHNGKTVMATRLSWELHIGPIPDKMMVLHKINCPNKNCVNPEHLYLGDAIDNWADWSLLNGKTNRIYRTSE